MRFAVAPRCAAGPHSSVKTLAAVVSPSERVSPVWSRIPKRAKSFVLSRRPKLLPQFSQERSDALERNLADRLSPGRSGKTPVAIPERAVEIAAIGTAVTHFALRDRAGRFMASRMRF